ncbi:MAG TPA: Ig-like domain-containing protein [Planctomycetota bacterium]|jgi:hypothetical protein|nr:Ig-like domain-containing protein [Planctomycetota bacterium]
MTFARRLLPVPFLLFLGCSGGGGSGTGTFFLVSCSLGCGSGGCAINQIAENQEIVLTFNRAVDPSSVGPETFSVVKAVPGGAAPPGTWLAQGSKAIFRPLLTFNSTGTPVFGFETNAPYQITVPAAPARTVIRSTGGSPNRTPLSCLATASQGVNDLVPGAPHVAVFFQSDPLNPDSLLPLADATCVPRGVPDPELPLPPGVTPAPLHLVFIFDDIMQPGTLVDPIQQTSPSINVSVKLLDPGPPPTESTIVSSVPGVFAISYDFTLLRTRVVFVPSLLFPGLGFDPSAGICSPPFPAGQPFRKVVVTLSPAILDLANPSPNPVVLAPNQNPVTFTTKPVNLSTFLVTEDFDTTARRDPLRTGALWNDPASPGVLKIGKGGGRGLHGDVVLSSTNLTLDTGNASFPASQTLTGTPLTVTDGIFEFGTVVIPQGRKLSFVGPNPARLFVRGQLVVGGTVELKGSPGEDHVGFSDAAQALFPQHPAGGLGGAGGPNAGAGGDGGSIDPTVTTSTAAWSSNLILDGEGGVGVGGPSGPGGGGAVGGLHYPTNLPPPGALPGEICPVTVECRSKQKSSGGGGGGYKTQGSDGLPGTPAFPGGIFTPCSQSTTIPPVTASPGGSAVVADPTLNPDLGLLFGGSGGAGSGVNPHDSKPGIPCNSTTVNTVPPGTVVYQSGCGGGGGGGAGQIQAGADVTINPGSLVDDSGGAGGSSLSGVGAAPGSGNVSGGGGGSGGALLIQSGREVVLPLPPPVFLIKVRGGSGGLSTTTQAAGGAGGDGYARIETDPAPSLASVSPYVDPPASLSVGTFVPFTGSPANFSGAASTWIDSSGAGSLVVTFDHYVLKAAFGDPANPPANLEDCGAVTCIEFDDDPATPNGPPVAGVHPLQIFFQGTEADANGLPDETQTTPWMTTLSGLNFCPPFSCPPRFVRFTVVFDQTLATTGPLPLLLAVLEVRLFLNTE